VPGREHAQPHRPVGGDRARAAAADQSPANHSIGPRTHLIRRNPMLDRKWLVVGALCLIGCGTSPTKPGGDGGAGASTNETGSTGGSGGASSGSGGGTKGGGGGRPGTRGRDGPGGRPRTAG